MRAGDRGPSQQNLDREARFTGGATVLEVCQADGGGATWATVVNTLAKFVRWTGGSRDRLVAGVSQVA